MTDDPIKVTVMAFATAAEAMGCRQESIHLARSATVGDAWKILQTTYPTLASLESTIAFACNDRLVDRSTPLEDGDALSLLPPVSGG